MNTKTMKNIFLLFTLTSISMACQKNDQVSNQLDLGKKMNVKYAGNLSSTANSNLICDKILVNVFNNSITVKDLTYSYPYNLINLSGLPHDPSGNSVLLANCIDNSVATEAQKSLHKKTDSMINMAGNALRILGAGKPKLPRLAPYTMQEFESAMDETPWQIGDDGADYVSSIFNKVIRKNPEIPQLPGISSVLAAAALSQHKNFTKITVEQVKLFTSRAEAFVIAVGLSSGIPRLTIVDHRRIKNNCDECETIETVYVREGPGEYGYVRMSSFFDYVTWASIQYYMYTGDY
ncbi:hypothetical protein SAMN05421820_103748 [Pedobacter steynii]|uniref:Uncharacterized protein n=1 Tax=Pedobacter steynii TaxID=430522 RepID=A0A1G9T0V2_9SPHI|nr:hypothetical protein [Pedobacter steynii]NQX37282.1 hypothetical protein [Pedobacter steynii]SDM40725.1 hypothetical protein SAMN05421820_103748 [Pedobacter steynii]